MPAGVIDTTYNMDNILLPSGTLKLTFLNDSGVTGTHSVAGDYLLTIAEVQEAVEENGIGGVLRIPDMQIELYDRSNTFRDTIFSKSTVTRCDVRIKLNVGGTDYGIMYGSVLLSTVEYPSYYDDEGTTESHSCRFTIFSILKQLESKTIASLRTGIASVPPVQKTPHVSIAVAHAAVSASAINTALGGSSASWLNTVLAEIEDLNAADVTLGASGTYSDYLVVTDFLSFVAGLVPASATIKGLKFIVHFKTDFAATIKEHSCKFVKAGVVSGNELAVAGDISSPSIFSPVTIGSTSELGGLAWTPSDISNTGFGIAFSIESTYTGINSVRGYVDFIDAYVYYETSQGDKYFVKEIDILDQIQKLITSSVDAIEHSIAQTFRHVDSTDPMANGGYADIWHMFKKLDGSLDYLWTTADSVVGSFSHLRDAKAVLTTICGMRVSYPILKMDPATNNIHLKIKQRGAGTVLNPADLGILKETSLQTFAEYAAFRLLFQNNALVKFSPSTMTQDQYNLIAQKYDFTSYFGMSTDEVFSTLSGTPEPQPQFYLWVTDGARLSNVNHLVEGSDDFDSMQGFLFNKFTKYWGSPSMVTRKYAGTGIGGASPVEILDRLNVGGVNYTIIDIKRNLVTDEMTVRAVSY